MYKKNYDSIHYWDALKDKNDLFEGSFNNLPLTKESIFINSVIFNKGEILDSWAYYPNAKVLLGFIKYVFLPSCYFNLFIKDEEDEEEAVIVDVEHPDIVVELLQNLSDLEENNIVINKDNIQEILNDVEEIDEMWSLDDNECIDRLILFLEGFNEKWSEKSEEVFFYLNIYSSPAEIADYLVNGYEEDGMYDLFEKDIEYTKEEFLNIANNVYGNKFLERKFIEILNNQLPLLV